MTIKQQLLKQKILKKIRAEMNNTVASDLEERLAYYQEFFEVESDDEPITATMLALSTDPDDDRENHIWMDGYCQAMFDAMNIIHKI